MNELSAAVTDTSGGWLATAQVDDQPDRRTFTSASGTRQRKRTEPSLSIERNLGASDQAGSSRSGPKSSAASAASRALSSADGMK
jgi:hypothetical protein